MAMRMRGVARIAVLVVGVALLATATGCEAGRFPVCKTNEECAARDAGPEAPVCYNLKCVQCRYDTDCKAGTCNSSNECESLVTAGKPDAPDAGDTPTAWEVGSWDQCAAECKDPACIKVCDEKFPKSPDQKGAPKKK
jgi:hypothetical protein